MAERTGYPAATFSTAYGVARTPADDWFDPSLQADTALFVDPFLMFDETSAPWSTVEQRLIDFFNEVLLQVAASRGGSMKAHMIASTMLSFPEPSEFCLGYGKKTIFGSGSGSGIGSAMLAAVNTAISAGINNLSDFGEMLLFGEGMGSDRISDLVCNVVKDSLIEYTQAVAARHGIPTLDFKVPHTTYDFGRHRWANKVVKLPANPCWKNTPVLLVPQRFLDDLPALNDDSFWDWVYDSHNAQLRQDLNILVTDKLDRRKIIARAKSRATLRVKYGRMYVASRRVHRLQPYDVDQDPKQLIYPSRAPAQFASLIQLSTPSTPAEFADFVFGLAGEFKRLVESQGIWREFWHQGAARDEKAAQRLFHTCVSIVCRIHDVDVSPETDAGVGPVDFKFSRGASKKSVVELKLASSSSFFNNLEEQPPAYMTAEDTDFGVIVVIQHEDKHCSDEFVDKATAAVERVSKERKIDYRVVFVDVRSQVSASKRKRSIPGDSDSSPISGGPQAEPSSDAGSKPDRLEDGPDGASEETPS